MCGISSPNINSKPQHICQYTSTNPSKWLNFGGKRTFPSLDSNMHFAGTSFIFVMPVTGILIVNERNLLMKTLVNEPFHTIKQ